MLDANIKQQLTAYLARIVTPIELQASLDDSAASQDMRALLQDIAAASDKVAVREVRLSRSPAFGIAPAGQPARVVFAGLPLGHEFTSLVLALLWVGGHPSKESEETLAQTRALADPLNFEAYISLSCHNCPDVVQALTLMASLNPNITVTVIDGALFQPEVESRQIMAVPTVYLNGQPFASGRMTLAEILAKVDTGAASRAAALLAQKEAFDVLVVGGGPAGAAAAIYAARKGIRTGVVAERFGGQVMDTLGIENFISVKATEGPKLAAALEEHVKSYAVDVMSMQRAQRLVPADRSGSGLVEVALESGAVLQAKSVIVATGARWREMNVPGEAQYKAKGVCFCPHCDGPLFKGKRVAVLGGGNSGVEAAIDLAGIVGHVTLLEYNATLRADAVLQKKLASLANVTVVTRAQTTEVLGDGQKVTGLAYRNLETGDPVQIELEGIFVQIGLLPNTDWLKDVVALSPRGELEVDARGQTSVPGVFAAGDCTTAPYKQIIISMGSGATAALSAFDHLIRA